MLPKILEPNKVVKLPRAVKSRGVVVNMIVNVILINVNINEKLMLALFPTWPFHSNFVCYFWHNLARRKRLPDLKEQSSSLHDSARCYLIGLDVGCNDSRTSSPSRKSGRQSISPTSDASRHFVQKFGLL